MFIIVNTTGNKLSGYHFYPNDFRLKLAYRKNDWYCYPTIKEAEEHLSAIRQYGIGKNLRVQEY